VFEAEPLRRRLQTASAASPTMHAARNYQRDTGWNPRFGSADSCDEKDGRGKQPEYPLRQAGLLRLSVLSALLPVDCPEGRLGWLLRHATQLPGTLSAMRLV
jgi:hypothetical protein